MNIRISKFPRNCRTVKMHCFIFLAIAFMTGLSDASQECGNGFYECRRGDNEFYLPETEDQLRENCDAMKRFLRCLKDDFEKCEDIKNYELASRYLSIAEDMCNENSLAYRGIVDNLLCLKGLFNNSDFCPMPMRLDIVQNYAELLKERGIPYLGLIEEDSFICTRQLYYYGCSLSRVNRECGNIARNAALEMLQKILVVAECREEVINDFPDFVTYYENEENKEVNRI